MQETLLITLRQMSVLFLFMLCGYALKKRRAADDALGGVLAKLELYIFLPALCFKTFAGNISAPVLADKAPYLLVSTLVLAAAFALALALARLFAHDRMTRAIYVYAFTIPNIGYVGYPLILGVYGEGALFDFMIYTLPYNIFIYSVGLYMLNPRRQWSLKGLVNPSILGILAGIGCGLLQMRLPAFAADAVDAAAACMAPVAMILTGFVLARSPLSTMLKNPRMYAAALIRLVGMPALGYAALLALGVSADIRLMAVAALALPMGLNNVVFPEAFGSDSTVGAQSCLISNVLGLATIPVVFALLAMLP